MSEATYRNASPPPLGEADRVALLRSYGILDTAPEQAFDDLVLIACSICKTPIGLVTFVTEGRQWFKSEVGLGLRETPIDIAFCAHVLFQPHLFVVPDTTKDSRFDCNPLVIGEPYLRFYAGALITSNNGVPLGTLCVLDYEPRPGITPEQGEVLLALARQGTILLEYRRTLSRLREYETP
jgi:GAF domain-containing protein